MPPPKVVYLLEGLKRGGVQAGALLQIPRLDSSRFAVETWVLRFGKSNQELAPEFDKAGIRVVHLPVHGFADRAGILALARRLAQEKVALLNTKSFFANIVGRTASMLVQTPAVVANYHHGYEHRWRPQYVARERVLSRHTDAFICVSQAVADYLHPLLQLPREKIRILYNGFDIERYNIAQSKIDLRRPLGFPLERPLITCVARLTSVKDIATYIAAAALVAKEIPEACFLVVGDGEEKENLISLAGQKGIGNRVQFLGSRNDVPEILNASDCFVLPSLKEGFGRVIIEAFASHVPVVATATGGVVEIVDHEKNGLLVPVSDPHAMAQAVVRTLRERAQTAERVAQAARDVRQYNLMTWVRKTEDIFQEAIDRHKSEIADYPSVPSPGGFSLALKYYRQQFAFRKMQFWVKIRG